MRYQKVWYVIKDGRWVIKKQSLGVGMSIMPTVALIRNHIGMTDWPVSGDEVEWNDRYKFNRKYVLLDRKNRTIVSEQDLMESDEIYEK